MLEFLILIRDVLLAVLMSWAGLDADSQEKKETPADMQESAYILPITETECNNEKTLLAAVDLHAS